MLITLHVNGEPTVASIGGWESLLSVLRDTLGLAGTKGACEQGECGSCSVILDGELVNSCLVMAGSVDGSTVVTVEGLGSAEYANDVQQALVEEGAIQCGFCTPGFVVSLTAMRDRLVGMSADDIREGISGNLCRCTGYAAIIRAAESLRTGSGE